MTGYNIQIRTLRKERNLSLKEASKGMGVNIISLYLYENGYFRPWKKHLKKINEFYNTKISLDNLSSYPTPDTEKINKPHDKKKVFISRIVFGTLAVVMLALSITGGVLFNRSVNNTESYYGEIYNDLREQVITYGSIGHDIVTSTEYYQVDYQTSENQASIVFYKYDSMLYFNEIYFSATDYDDDLGLGRYHYKFGDSLGVKSNVCNFTYGSMTTGTYFSCRFDFTNEHVTDIDNFVIRVKADENFDKEMAIRLVNQLIDRINPTVSAAMSEELSKNVDFYNDFIPAREEGRIINFNLQILGLFLLIPCFILFFVFIGIFTYLMVLNIKPRLVDASSEEDNVGTTTLPKDINLKIGIPDIVVLFIARAAIYLSIIFMVFGFIGKLGIFSLPSLFSNSNFLNFLKISLLAGMFLNYFIVLGRHKRPEAILKKISYNLYLYLFIASLETLIIFITNSWGYDFATLIFSYLPGNIFQVIAVQYIIYLFLFFQPPFLNKKGKLARYLWHSISLIPLGLLLTTYFISNSYNLTYGVKENLFINFWFPNGFLPLSLVSTAFMYSIFGLGLFFEHRFGTRKAQLFSYGDTYTLIENSICVFFIIVMGVLDLVFMKNQYAYYLGLGFNQWIFTLIPFIIICKYSPNKKQTVILGEEIISRNIQL